MGKQPELTIAIATRDRPGLLAEVLRSCARQRLDDALFEILVVADGESDGTSSVCESFAKDLAQSRKDLVFRFIEPWRESRGLAAARNACSDEAAGKYIRFQDDDDVLEPYASDGMLNAHYENGRHVAVLGYTGIAAHLLEVPIMWYLAKEGGELFDYRAVPDRLLDFEWFWGGRTSVSTTIARSVGFDENLRFGAEDIEFAFRATQAARLGVRYSTAVRSFMIRSVDLGSFAYRCHRQGLAARYVAAKHPRSLLQEWAEKSHAYTTWSGDGGEAFTRAFERCRKLELAVDCQQQIGEYIPEQRRILAAAYHETFGIARSLGFAGIEISIR